MMSARSSAQCHANKISYARLPINGEASTDGCSSVASPHYKYLSPLTLF